MCHPTKHPAPRRVALLLLGLQAINAGAGQTAADAPATRLPLAFHAAFCGDAESALRDETGSQELSRAYSAAVLVDLKHREQTQARGTRDVLNDMRAEYCAPQGGPK